jgi:hypothetical protein
MVVVATTEAIPVASSSSAVAVDAGVVGELAVSVVEESPLEHADKIRAEDARRLSNSFFVVVMERT